MTDVVILMKDGTKREFLHKGRPGGSYTKSVRYDRGFVIVIDEWRDEIAIPTADVAEVRVTGRDGW